MKLYLQDLTEVKIEPIYQTRDMNIDAKVKFLENGREINIDKKGDGTKRRLTMALLEYKKEESLTPQDETTFYLLDEPDTHLHVKAQMEMLSTIKSFSDSGNQVLLTTHSPFLINSVKPKQLRMLHVCENESKIKYLKTDSEASNEVIKSLGIENTFLFFSRHIIIVEGETEESFIPHYYLRKKGLPLSSALVKIINSRGIKNIPGFSNALLEITNPNNIYMVIDNDASSETQELIDQLNIPDERKFIIGTKEFEDSFPSETLHDCWKLYLEGCGKAVPDTWSSESIETMKSNCLSTETKFSKKLRQLNSGSGKKMTKPIFGIALAEHIEDKNLPEQFNELLAMIQEA